MSLGRTVGSIPIVWPGNSITGLPPITLGWPLDGGGPLGGVVGSNGDEEG